MPEYLLRACPASLREGRRLKTKFRLGCHDLRSSSSRTQLVRNAQCPCCESRESETIQHTLLECSAFTKERDTFLKRFYEMHPIARGLSPEGLCDVLMRRGSTTPPRPPPGRRPCRSSRAPLAVRTPFATCCWVTTVTPQV